MEDLWGELAKQVNVTLSMSWLFLHSVQTSYCTTCPNPGQNIGTAIKSTLCGPDGV
jgi:hypothetical protein